MLPVAILSLDNRSLQLLSVLPSGNGGQRLAEVCGREQGGEGMGELITGWGGVGKRQNKRGGGSQWYCYAMDPNPLSPATFSFPYSP